MISKKEQEELNNALNTALHAVESVVSWAESRGLTNEQSYIDWEDKINKLSIKDHNINFHNFKYVD